MFAARFPLENTFIIKFHHDHHDHDHDHHHHHHHLLENPMGSWKNPWKLPWQKPWVSLGAPHCAGSINHQPQIHLQGLKAPNVGIEHGNSMGILWGYGMMWGCIWGLYRTVWIDIVMNMGIIYGDYISDLRWGLVRLHRDFFLRPPHGPSATPPVWVSLKIQGNTSKPRVG